MLGIAANDAQKQADTARILASSVISAIESGRTAECRFNIHEDIYSELDNTRNVRVTYENEDHQIKTESMACIITVITDGEIQAALYPHDEESFIWLFIPQTKVRSLDDLRGEYIDIPITKAGFQIDFKTREDWRYEHVPALFMSPYLERDIYRVEYDPKNNFVSLWMKVDPNNNVLTLCRMPLLEKPHYRTDIDEPVYENGKLILPYSQKEGTQTNENP